MYSKFNSVGLLTSVRVPFEVRGLGIRVQSVGFGVWGLGFRVWGFGFRTKVASPAERAAAGSITMGAWCRV